jgi:cell volume regulation protein A
MSETAHFALILLVSASVGLVAVLSNRLTDRLRVPVPVIVLVGSALAVKLAPGLHAPQTHTVERLVTVALVCILFDGGMHLGWRRFRAALTPIALAGGLGTFLTTAGAAAVLHVGFTVDWFPAVLVATAIAPTDPAVVFSVLGRHEIAGRSGTILEGESGANDPVGLALMAGLLAAGGLSGAAVAHIGAEFGLQMLIGAAVGVTGGRLLLWFVRQVPLPREGLYPLRTLAAALLLYGAATLAHGSGFLAVFVAGIVLGDERAPFRSEIRSFHATLANLAEIVAFVVLGSTVDLEVLVRPEVWGPGLLVWLAVSLAIRPALGGLCLLPARLTRNELTFVLFAGLKGAVPILLGLQVRDSGVTAAERLYGIVVVVVVLSVVGQGSLVPAMARGLRIRMRTVDPYPWALGVRLRHRPDDVHRFTVARGAPVDGRPIDELDELGPDCWITFVVRDGALLRVGGDTELRAGDDVVIQADAQQHSELTRLFAGTEGSPQ